MGSSLPLRGWLFGRASRRTVLVYVFLDPGRIPEPCLRQVLGVQPTTASWLMNPPPEVEVVDDVVTVHPTRITLSRRATAPTVKRNNLPIGALSIYAEDGAGAWDQPHPPWRASVVEPPAPVVVTEPAARSHTPVEGELLALGKGRASARK